MAAKKTVNFMDIPFRTRNDRLEATWCFEREYNRCMPHFHLAMEVVYVERGEMSGLIDGREISICAGQMAVISSYSIHTFSTAEYSLVIVAVIPMDFVPAMYVRLRNRVFSRVLIENPEPDLPFLMKLLLRSYKQGSRETVQGISQALLGLLADRYGTQPAVLCDSAGIMHLVIPYMQQHFMEDISLDTLAVRFNYSKSRLSHLFRRQMNMTFTDFLGALRCRYAVKLLSAGANTVIEVAEQSGFRSVATFYRVFRRYYGVAPLEYIRKKAFTEESSFEDS